MKKIIFIVSILFIFILSSCDDVQNKFVSSSSDKITNENWFLVTHADSTDLLPCIVMEDYVLVILDTGNETQILKMEDMSGEFASFSLFMAVVLFISLIAIIIIIDR